MKMVETPNQAIINMCPQLDNRMQFTLNETNRIKDYFIAEIFEGKKMSKSLSKHIGAFYYVGKALFALSATSLGVSIASFATFIIAPIRRFKGVI